MLLERAGETVADTALPGARFVVKGETGPPVEEAAPTPEQGKPKTTYRQDWKSYNRAQTTEKHRLQELLADLVAGVPEPAYAGTGRKPVPA